MHSGHRSTAALRIPPARCFCCCRRRSHVLCSFRICVIAPVGVHCFAGKDQVLCVLLTQVFELSAAFAHGSLSNVRRFCMVNEVSAVPYAPVAAAACNMSPSATSVTHHVTCAERNELLVLTARLHPAAPTAENGSPRRRLAAAAAGSSPQASAVPSWPPVCGVARCDVSRARDTKQCSGCK